MAIWQYDIVAVPRERVTSICGALPAEIPTELFDSHNWWRGTRAPDDSEFAALLPASSSWSQSIRAWGIDDGNRIEVYSDKDEVYEVKIRIDMRRPSREFLDAIIEMAIRYDWLYWTEEGRLIEPDRAALISDIEKSQAFSFARAPSGYLDELSNRQTD